MYAGTKRCEFFRMRRFRNEFPDETACGFLQGSRGFSSLGIANDAAVGGIWCVLVDSCECERLRIRPGSVPVGAEEKNRAIRKQLVGVFIRVFAQDALDAGRILGAIEIGLA